MSDLRAVLVSLYGWFREALWRLAYKPHEPFDLAGDGSGPAWCWHCSKVWPCKPARRLTAARDGWAR